MDLYPAIDLRGGQVVRLAKGDYDAETVYGSAPVAVAKSLEAAGAPWIHVVDLDGARTGDATNRSLITDIASAVSVKVQSGGGIRDTQSAEDLLATGVQRIVIGTAATKDPDMVKDLASRYPGRIAVGLDARNGMVATEGWMQDSGMSVLDMVHLFSTFQVAAFIVTDIERDGMLGGSDTEGLAAVLNITDIDVIASGGVGSLDDLSALCALQAPNGNRLSGAITGKALYENKFSLEDAVKVATGS